MYKRQVENGRVDESRLVWLSNRGIRISAIVAYLLSPASQVDQHPLIQTLRSPASVSVSYTHLVRRNVR